MEKSYDPGRPSLRGHAGRHTSKCSVPNSHLLPLAWSSASKALASTSIAALVGILLVVGAAYLQKYLLMQSQA